MFPRRKPSCITKLTDIFDQGLYSVMEIVLLALPLQEGQSTLVDSTHGDHSSLPEVIVLNRMLFSYSAFIMMSYYKR